MYVFTVLTGKQPQPSEERIEETRQQEAQPVVVAGNAFTIEFMAFVVGISLLIGNRVLQIRNKCFRYFFIIIFTLKYLV